MHVSKARYSTTGSLLAAALVLFTALVPATSGRQLSQSDDSVQIVTTAEQLQSALDGGATNIEVQSHIDVSHSSTPHPASSSAYPAHFKLGDSTVSITGNCEGVAPFEPSHPLSPPLAALTPGQCVILVRYDTFLDAPQRSELLLQSLLIRADRPVPLPVEENPSLEVYCTLAFVQTRTFWAVNVTLQGDGRQRCGGLKVFGSAFVTGSQLLNFGGTEAMFVGGGATVTVHGTRFASNGVTSAALTVEGTVHLAAGNAFSDNAPADVEVRGDREAVVYADRNRGLLDVTVSEVSRQDGVQPLSKLPSGQHFASDEDARLIQLHRSLEVAERKAPLSTDNPSGQSESPSLVLSSGLPLMFLALLATGMFVFRRSLLKAFKTGDRPAQDKGAPAGAAECPDRCTGSSSLVTPQDDQEPPPPPTVCQSQESLSGVISQLSLPGPPLHRLGSGTPSSIGLLLPPEQYLALNAHSASSPPKAAVPLPVLQSSASLSMSLQMRSASEVHRLPFSCVSNAWTSQCDTLSTILPLTTDGSTESAQLVTALDNQILATPPVPFQGRYLLLGERAFGGQAVVQFARDAGGGAEQFAIKFFLSRDDYRTEMGLYNDPAMRQVLPALVSWHANDPASSRTVLSSPSGFVFPPFMVVERGETMAAWQQEERSSHTVLNAFEELAMSLESLHGAGHVHRDLKPANVLITTKTHKWRLIDFGISGKRGSHMTPRCTLGYAAPEVIHALACETLIQVHPAQDIWALGVLIYECVTGTRVFDKFVEKGAFFACARGDQRYPWEADALHAAFARCRCRKTLLSCLHRDAARRPSAADVANMLDDLGSSSTLPSELLRRSVLAPSDAASAAMQDFAHPPDTRS